MEIKQFSEIELSNDGTAIIVAAERADEAGLTKLSIPYRHAMWLAQAIFAVAHQAVERQAASGAIEPTTIAGDALQAEDLRLLVKPGERRAAVAATGTWTSNGAPGTTTLLVDSSIAEALIDQLREFVQMAQTLSRPS